jgi:hypothetical protein
MRRPSQTWGSLLTSRKESISENVQGASLENAPLLSNWGVPIELSLTFKRIVHLCVCECEDVYLRHSLEKCLSTRVG